MPEMSVSRAEDFPESPEEVRPVAPGAQFRTRVGVVVQFTGRVGRLGTGEWFLHVDVPEGGHAAWWNVKDLEPVAPN